MEYREEMRNHLSDLNQDHQRREDPTEVATTPEVAQLIKRDQQRENEDVIDQLNTAAEEIKRKIRTRADPGDDSPEDDREAPGA